MNIEEAIEILKEFKKTGFHTLMIKYNKDRIHTNKIIEQAIETLLTAYEKEKEKNKTLKQENSFLKMMYRETDEFKAIENLAKEE